MTREGFVLSALSMRARSSSKPAWAEELMRQVRIAASTMETHVDRTRVDRFRSMLRFYEEKRSAGKLICSNCEKMSARALPACPVRGISGQLCRHFLLDREELLGWVTNPSAAPHRVLPGPLDAARRRHTRMLHILISDFGFQMWRRIMILEWPRPAGSNGWIGTQA
jgi:hypothetical protein